MQKRLVFFGPPARRAFLILFAAISAAGISSSRAATYIWDPNGNRSDAAGSGLWNTTSPIWDSGTVDVTWPNNSPNTATFNGADGAYTVTAISGLMGTGATFNASGYTLAGASAASPGSLTFAFAMTGVLNVATGKTMTIGSNMTVTAFNGANINYQSPTYAGSIVVNNGGVFSLGNSSIGGTFTVGPGGTANAVGSAPILAGGTLNVNGTGASFVVRGLQASGGAVVNVSQGTLDTSGAFGLYLNGGTLNLNGGTFIDGPFTNGSTASVVHFNGGLVTTGTVYPAAFGNNASTLTLTVQAGGAKFGNGGALTIPNSLLHDTSGPAIDGGLAKSGAGALTLSVADTYTGGTTISGGTLVAGANGALGSGDASVLATSVSLKIGTGVVMPFSNLTARLSLSGGGAADTADAGYLDLTNGANIIVGSLVLGTTVYTAGVFSSATFPEYISGTGTVTVVPEPTSLACLLVVLLVGGWSTSLLRRSLGAKLG